MKPITIIGSGLAGYTVAKEFRKLDKATPLLIITGDDGGFYSKPMLSNAFALGRQAHQLLNQTADQMAEQLGARIFTQTFVTAVNTESKTLETSQGQFSYRKLILASGAQPIRLPIDGDAADQVLSVNNLADYAAFRQRLDVAGSQARVVILGAGLIGCEFSDDLVNAGYTVSLIDPNTSPLSALAPAAISQGLRETLQAKGVQLKLGTTASKIEHDKNALKISLANGETLLADVVLSAVGLRAETKLAKTAQLTTERGILVNEYGQTSANDVYALGDCAQYRQSDGSHLVMPYVAPLMAAAKAIAHTLSGTVTKIEMKPAAILVKTPSYPVALIPPASNISNSGNWESRLDAGVTTSRFLDHNRVLRGFALAPQDAKSRNHLMNEYAAAQLTNT